MDAWIRRRLPVWVALAALFVDMELGRCDYQLIADAIRSAGFTVAEAESILRNELAPAFVRHLMTVASEWTGWRDDAALETMFAQLGASQPRRRTARRNARVAEGPSEAEWAKVVAQLER